VASFSYSVGAPVKAGAVVQRAAYQQRDIYYDATTQRTFDYRVRSEIAARSDHDANRGEWRPGQEVAAKGMEAPEQAPAWARRAENGQEFWNRAVAAERRRDAQIATPVILALPHELVERRPDGSWNVEKAAWALKDHLKEYTREGRVVQWAIHTPDAKGDDRNWHAHLLISNRGVEAGGFKKAKAQEQTFRYTHRAEYTTGKRENWARVANHHLTRHGHEARIDHRSYRGQGVDREPTQHLGPNAMWQERQGIQTEWGDRNREIAARNAERQRQALDEAAAARHANAASKPPATDAAAPFAAEAHDRRERTRREVDQQPAPPAPSVAQAHDRRQAQPRRGLFWGVKKMLGQAFGWDAAVIRDRHQQPARPQPLAERQPEKAAQEKLAGERPLGLYERQEMRRREAEQRRPQREQSTARNSALYERYQAEREAAVKARAAAEQEVRDQFAAYATNMKAYYGQRFEQEKTEMPSWRRRQDMEILAAQRRGDRGRMIQLEREAIADVRRAHPLPGWGAFIEREAGRGDQDAAQALQRRNEKKAERDRDDGRGIEPS
jgi:MobA/MobL family